MNRGQQQHSYPITCGEAIFSENNQDNYLKLYSLIVGEPSSMRWKQIKVRNSMLVRADFSLYPAFF